MRLHHDAESKSKNGLRQSNDEERSLLREPMGRGATCDNHEQNLLERDIRGLLEWLDLWDGMKVATCRESEAVFCFRDGFGSRIYYRLSVQARLSWI